MAFIGNQPAESFTSFATQEFSTSATTSYTLDHAVANENEIALFVNNVRQQPGSGKAYTATGTALTLSAATASTDTMYCVFLGRALQTVTPATNSITAAMVSNDLISGKDALTSSPDDTDELLISDAGTLKRIDVSLVGGKNTPAFQATMSGNQSISNSTETKIQFDTEDFDTDSKYDHSSNYRFTPTVAGKYHVTIRVNYEDVSAEDKYQRVSIYKNGSSVQQHGTRSVASTGRDKSTEVNGIVTLDTDDYIEAYTSHNSGSSKNIQASGKRCLFQAYKIIT